MCVCVYVYTHKYDSLCPVILSCTHLCLHAFWCNDLRCLMPTM